MKSIINKIGNLTLGIGIGIGLSMGMQGLAALTVDLGVDGAVQYIKKIFLTTDGTNSTTADVKISLDGTNGNVSMEGDLSVGKNAYVGWSLHVYDDLYLSGEIYDINDGDVTIGESMNINGNLYVRDAIYDNDLDDDDVNIGENLSVSGNIDVNNKNSQSLISVKGAGDGWTYSALYLGKYGSTNNQYSWVIAGKQDPQDSLDIGLWKNDNYQRALHIKTGAVSIDGNLYWGTRGILSRDQGASIELGGGGTPYIDFKNDISSDYDMRIRLIDNDGLAIEGGNLSVDGAIKTTCIGACF